MRKDKAMEILAKVGSAQVLVRTVKADVETSFEEARMDSDLETTLNLAMGVVQSLSDLLDVARAQAEKEYDAAEVVPS